MSGPEVTYAVLGADELHPHEQVEAEAVAELARAIREQGVVERPVVVDAESRVILDGHHRFAALRALGCTHIPCYLVDYADEAITVDRWDENGALAKDAILRAATSQELLPPKTSRHATLRDLPERPTPLPELGVTVPPGGGS